MKEAADPSVKRGEGGGVLIEVEGAPYECVFGVDLETLQRREPKGWRCRRGWHKYKRVATPYLSPDAGIEMMALYSVSMKAYEDLRQCERCGEVARRMR